MNVTPPPTDPPAPIQPLIQPPATKTYQPAETPAKKTGKARKIGGVAGGIVVAGGILLLKAGLIFGGSAAVHSVADHANDAKRDGTGAVVKAGRLDATSLHAGDCWQDDVAGKSQANVNEVAVVPCTTPHNAQVVVVSHHTGAFPSGDGMADWCSDDITAWGESHKDVLQATLDKDADASLIAFSQQKDKWKADGSNTVVCSLESADATLDTVLPAT